MTDSIEEDCKAWLETWDYKKPALETLTALVKVRVEREAQRQSFAYNNLRIGDAEKMRVLELENKKLREIIAGDERMHIVHLSPSELAGVDELASEWDHNLVKCQLKIADLETKLEDVKAALGRDTAVCGYSHPATREVLEK